MEEQNDVLSENPIYCLEASKRQFSWCLHRINEEITPLSTQEIYEILRCKFSDDSSGLIIPFFFSLVDLEKREISQMRKDFDAFTARIDIKLLPETDMADFKIISISDDRAGVWKPDLFQKGGIGYVIYSYAGKLEFITKASSDGKVRLNLRGINVYASEDKSEQNFEVIVVDDCSKDSSCKVIESYIPKFNGRLSLYHMSRNSGSAPAPRNNGFLVSRGEYIFFMDSDDTLTKTALEEIYTLAKEYDADVVYCEKYYMSTGVGEEYIKNIHLADNRIQKPPFVDKPTFISDKLSDRLDDLLAGKFWVTPWQRFVSRKLLAENEINFPEIIG